MVTNRELITGTSHLLSIKQVLMNHLYFLSRLCATALSIPVYAAPAPPGPPTAGDPRPYTRIRRPMVVSFIGILLGIFGLAPDGRAQTVFADFNGDGYSDLAIGVPSEDVGSITDAGAVNVIYGSANGLASSIGSGRLWTQNGRVPDSCEDGFGYALAAGDFNRDGYGDLAISSLGTIGGAVNIIYGSPQGLINDLSAIIPAQCWTQEDLGIGEVTGVDDRFGGALAAGDFNHDRYTDLAIGIPGKIRGAGAVSILHGSAAGLSAFNTQFFYQETLAGSSNLSETGDHFGAALAVGDFDGDRVADLAIGIPDEDIGSVINAGAVAVVYGSNIGLTGTGNQFWHQNSPGILDSAEKVDNFGLSLAAGDFNSDGFSDLAIGVPFERLGSVFDTGAVNVLYGSANGLSANGNQFWNQNSPGIPDTAEEADVFGYALAAGDFDHDGITDLAVGVTGENAGALIDTGAVQILYGTANRLSSNRNQLWTQNSPNVLDIAEPYDNFGYALTAGDFNGDGFADLAIGLPGESVGSDTNEGAVQVLYGAGAGTGGLSATGNQFWSQDSPGIADNAEFGDFFGGALAGR